MVVGDSANLKLEGGDWEIKLEIHNETDMQILDVKILHLGNKKLDQAFPVELTQ